MALNPVEIVGGIAIGEGVGGAVTAVVEPKLQGFKNGQWAAHPDLPLPPDVAAGLEAEGYGGAGSGAGEAQQSGVNGGRYQGLLESQRTAPDVGTLLELRRRQYISDQLLQAGLAKARIKPEYRGAIAALTEQLLSSAELALAQQQGFVDAARANTEGGLQGVNPERQQIRFELAGLPPGAAYAQDLANRGLIDQATFAQIVREGHTKTKYTDLLWRAKAARITPAGIANLVIRKWITQAQGTALLAEWGYNAEQSTLLVDGTGRPPGPGQLTAALNRGAITLPDVQRGIAQSDIRPEWEQVYLALRYHAPSLFQISRLAESGTVSDATLSRWLQWLNFSPADAAEILAGFKEGKTKATKDLTVAQIETLYEAGFMDEGQASTLITQLGYDANETAAILSLARARRVLAFLRAAINRVHAQYVGHRIDRNQALTALNNIVPAPDASSMYIALWDEERAANVRPLTQAQVVKARNVGAIDQATANQRLLDLGYSQVDATILLAR